MKKIATYYVFSGANTALVKVEQPIPELNAGEILVRSTIHHTLRQ